MFPSKESQIKRYLMLPFVGEPKTVEEMTRDELLEVIEHLENSCAYLQLKEHARLELKARGMVNVPK